jgi:hypothetical protein
MDLRPRRRFQSAAINLSISSKVLYSAREAGTVLSRPGPRRVLPLDIDHTFWEVLDVDHAKLLRNAVLWATNEPAPLSVKGRGVLDISVWGQKNSMTAHLVNLTNPIMMKGPVREITPISSQRVYVPVPSDRRVTKAHLLVAGNEIPFHKEGDMTVLEVPTINLHEVIALDFAV